jgi:hypothetical protein
MRGWGVRRLSIQTMFSDDISFRNIGRCIDNFLFENTDLL